MATHDGAESLSICRMAASGDLAGVRNQISSGVSVDSQDGTGQTALMHAAERGQTKVVTALLNEFKADTKIRDGVDNATALHHAAQHGRTEIVTLLLGAGADASLRNLEGKTAQELAESAAVIQAFTKAASSSSTTKSTVNGTPTKAVAANGTSNGSHPPAVPTPVAPVPVAVVAPSSPSAAVVAAASVQVAKARVAAAHAAAAGAAADAAEQKKAATATPSTSSPASPVVEPTKKVEVKKVKDVEPVVAAVVTNGKSAVNGSANTNGVTKAEPVTSVTDAQKQGAVDDTMKTKAASDDSFDRVAAAPVPVWPAKKATTVAAASSSSPSPSSSPTTITPSPNSSKKTSTTGTPSPARPSKKVIASQTLPTPIVAAVATPVVEDTKLHENGNGNGNGDDSSSNGSNGVEEVKTIKAAHATPVRAPKSEAVTSTPGNGTPGTASKVCSVCKKTVLKKDFALNQYKKPNGAKCKECSGSNSLTPAR